MLFGSRIWKKLCLLIVMFSGCLVVCRLFGVKIFWVLMMCILVFSCRFEGSLLFWVDWLFGWCWIWYSRFWNFVWLCLKLVVDMLVRLLEMVVRFMFWVDRLVLLIYSVDNIVVFFGCWFYGIMFK